jgi:hypothetical protein
MRRVVNLMHRQAVRAKAEGLFFNVKFSSSPGYIAFIIPDYAGFHTRPIQDLAGKPTVVSQRSTLQRSAQFDQLHPSPLF